MTFDSSEDGGVSEDEREAAEQNARIRLRLWQRRALYTPPELLSLSCALVYPFVDGRRLSAQGEAIKQGLLVLWMAPVPDLPVLYFAAVGRVASSS